MDTKRLDQFFSARYSILLTACALLGVQITAILSLFLLNSLGVIDIDQLKTPTNSFLLLLGMQITGALIAFGFLLKRLRSYTLPASVLGFRRAPVWRSLGYIVGYYAIMAVFLTCFAFIAMAAGLEPPDDQLESRIGGFWPAFIASVLIGPVIEEVLFRGLLFKSLSRKYSITASVIISGVIFAAVHLNPVGFVLLLPMGIYLSFMYHRLGSIIPGIILHASWNLLTLFTR